MKSKASKQPKGARKRAGPAAPKRAKKIRRENAQGLRPSRDQLEMILHGVAGGITVLEPTGQLIYANQGAAHLIGFATPEELVQTPVDEIISRFEMMDETGTPLPLSQLPGQLALTGQQPLERLVRFRIKATGEERWSRVKATPLLDEQGRVQMSVSTFRDVTERQRAEEALNDQREYLRVTLSSIGDAVIAMDTQGCVTLMNPVAQALTGWSESEARGRPMSEVFRIVNEQTLAPSEDPVARVIREGVVVGLANHTALVTKDGRRVPVEDSAAPIQDGRGKLVGVVLVFRDATERRRAEAAIGQLAAIVESSDDVIIGKNLEGTITSWNQAAERLYGYRAAEAIGQSMSILVPPDRPDELPALLERLERGEEIERFETERRTKDGRRVPVEITLSPVKDKSGENMGASVVARDITKRKQREADQRFLLEASELLAGSLDYETTLSRVAHLAVPHLADWCTVDIAAADGSLQQLALAHADPAKVAWARELQSRYPPDPNASSGVYQVLRTGRPEYMTEIPEALMLAAARDEEQVRIIRELGLKSYMVVPLIARGHTLGALTFVSGESGRRYGPEDLALAQELAGRAALAVDNARLYREAQQAIQMRDQFVAIASHELKTPITTLMGYSELISRWSAQELNSSPRQIRAIRAITEQTTRLNRMVNMLLDLSRIESGQLTIDRTQVDLTALTSRVVDEIRPILEKHTIALITEDASLLVEGEEPRLEQIVQNLIQNAIKYSPKGGPIGVQVRREGEMACIQVSDHGIGIPEAERANLFRRFFRAQNAEAWHIRGTGIGLYLVKEIIQLHGGEISVESREGEGSTFTVHLPLSRNPVVPDPDASTVTTIG